MKKRIITTLLVAVLGLSSGITAFAAPKTMPDGNVFDAEYYASTYADVKEALGTDEVMLYKHYLDYGKKEGRKPTADNEQSLNQGSTEVSNSSGLTFEEMLIEPGHIMPTANPQSAQPASPRIGNADREASR